MQDAQQTIWKAHNVVGPHSVQHATCVRWLIVVIMTLAIGLLLTDVAAALGGDDSAVVRLYPTAIVTSDEITLKDVAALDAEATQMAGDWRVASAPLPGESATVDIRRVEKVLEAGGANLSRWVVRGASRCRVSRPVEPGAKVAKTPASPVAGTNPQTPETKRIVPVQQTSQFNTNTLEGTLRKHIADRVAGLGGRPIARFSPAIARLLAMSRPTYNFRITDTSDRLIGRTSFNVAIYENGKLTQSVPVLAEVLLAKPTIVAAGNINRGQTIQRNDLQIEEQCFYRAEDVTSITMNALIGQRAKRLIRQRSRIRPQDVESIPLVERNDLVTVWVRWGHLVVKSSARAMEAGCLGDVIQLRNEMSKQTFAAQITGYKTAELPRPAGEAVVAMAEGVR
jgi:flagella basal body P-ring formation protein FlgA